MTDINDIELELAGILRTGMKPEITQTRALGLAVSLHHEWVRAESSLSAGKLRKFLKELFNVKGMSPELALRLWTALNNYSKPPLPDTKQEEVLSIRLLDGVVDSYRGYGFEVTTRDGLWLQVKADSGLKTNYLAYNVHQVLSIDVRPYSTLMGPKR